MRCVMWTRARSALQLLPLAAPRPLARLSSTLPSTRAPPLASPHRAPVQPVQAAPPPALQRPQKHKAKKSARGKPASPASSPSPLLPVGVRTPAAHDRTRPPPDGRVVALTTAESYNTPELLKSLQALGLLDGAVNVLGEAILLPRWSPASSTFFDAAEAGAAAGTGAGSEVGQVFIFESGTIVLWGLSMTAAETFLRKVIRGGAAGTGAFVEEGRYPEPETEVLDYWVGQRCVFSLCLPLGAPELMPHSAGRRACRATASTWQQNRPPRSTRRQPTRPPRRRKTSSSVSPSAPAWRA